MPLPPLRRPPRQVAFAALLALTLSASTASVAEAASSHARPAIEASGDVVGEATGGAASDVAGGAAGKKVGSAVSGHWLWPIASPHPIVRPFIAPPTPYGRGHRGIDVAAPLGSDIRAPADGVIHFSGVVVDRHLVSIDHGGGLISSFEPVLSELAEGTIVHRGDRIGALQSGHCGAPCLHLGVRLHGQYVSPLKYLGGIPYSVLLPTRPLP